MIPLGRWHRPIAAALALSPPVGCAWFAEDSGRWDLFERTGSITAAVGLALASRRYLQHGIAELASLHTSKASSLHAKDDIHSTKLGLALSAFGMLISGWGRYLGWWSFLFAALWAVLAIRDILRDLRLSRYRSPESDEPSGRRTGIEIGLSDNPNDGDGNSSGRELSF